MSDAAIDPHTQRDGKSLTLLITFINRINYLGPSPIVTGAVIGAGELVLITSLGAAAGQSLLCWLFISCWCKTLIQAELARDTITCKDIKPNRMTNYGLWLIFIF